MACSRRQLASTSSLQLVVQHAWHCLSGVLCSNTYCVEQCCLACFGSRCAPLASPTPLHELLCFLHAVSAVFGQLTVLCDAVPAGLTSYSQSSLRSISALRIGMCGCTLTRSSAATLQQQLHNSASGICHLKHVHHNVVPPAPCQSWHLASRATQHALAKQ